MRRLLVALLVIGLAACSASGSGTTAASDLPPLTIEGRAFGAAPTVSPGDSFDIVNLDSVRHTFSSGDGSWKQVDVPGNATVTFTVPASLAAGSYVFFCAVHSDMGGTLTVGG